MSLGRVWTFSGRDKIGLTDSMKYWVKEIGQFFMGWNITDPVGRVNVIFLRILFQHCHSSGSGYCGRGSFSDLIKVK